VVQSFLARSAATSERGESPRLSEALRTSDRDDFGSIAALPSNVRAIEAALLFGSCFQDHVAILGPSGWGKSHLLHAAAKNLRRRLGAAIAVVSAVEWTTSSSHWELATPVLLDDVQDALKQPRLRQSLRAGLERRVKCGRPTLLSFTAEGTSRLLRTFLPHQREWLVATMSEPSPLERELVARQIAASKGMVVAQAILNLLAKKTAGNGRSLEGALERLKLSQARWVDSDEILRGSGILGPYLGDEHGWDLRDHVHEVITSAVHENRSCGLQAPVDTDMALSVMLHEVGIGENEVASFYRVSPGEAYARASFSRTRSKDDGVSLFLRARCIEALVHSFEHL